MNFLDTFKIMFGFIKIACFIFSFNNAMLIRKKTVFFEYDKNQIEIHINLVGRRYIYRERTLIDSYI